MILIIAFHNLIFFFCQQKKDNKKMFTIEKFNFLAGNDHLTVEFFDFLYKINKNPCCEQGEAHKET